MSAPLQDTNHVVLEISDDVENLQPLDEPRLRQWSVNTNLMPVHSRQGLSSGLNNFLREISPFVDQVNNTNLRPHNLWLNRITSNVQESTSRSQVETASTLNVTIPHRTHANLGPNTSMYAVQDDLPNVRNLERSRSIPVLNVSEENNNVEQEPEANPVALNPIASNQQESREEPREDEENQANNGSVGTLTAIRMLYKYAPVLLILVTKYIYDHRFGMTLCAALIFTFNHANNVVKEEATKHTNRNISRLILAAIYTVCCVFFADFINSNYYGNQYSTYLVLLPMSYRPIGLWDMLWVICVTDFLLKFFTIDIKILVTCLPEKMLPFKKRGKIYYFIESVSQFYRCLVPLQPWICYLLESYEGYEKIFAVFLSTAYIVSKGYEVVKKGNFLTTAGIQLFKTSSLGVTPTAEEVDAAGKVCPICHDEYYSPILLSCSHIFCEMCISVWLNKVQTCPLCRANVTTDTSWRDGTTGTYYQLY